MYRHFQRGLDLVRTATQKRTTRRLVTTNAVSDRTTFRSQKLTPRTPLPTRPQGLPPVLGLIYVLTCAL